MTEPTSPTTITRMFDSKIWGLQKEQLTVLFLAMAVTSVGLLLKGLFCPESQIAKVLVWTISAFSWIFFFLVGLNREALYNFRRRMWFMISKSQGEEQIRKFDEKDENKTRNFTHSKNVYKNGFVEFWPVNKGNNWAVYFEIFGFTPDELEVFVSNAETMLSSVDDGTEIITVLKARKNTEDHAETFDREIKKGKFPNPLLRDICYEQAQLCRGTNTYSYETHMGLLIPYETNREAAFNTLENIASSVSKSLKQIGIEHRRLKTSEQIYAMFDGMITHNVHVPRRYE